MKDKIYENWTICPGCGYGWLHKGKLLYAVCPNCRKMFKKVKVKENEQG